MSYPLDRDDTSNLFETFGGLSTYTPRSGDPVQNIYIIYQPATQIVGDDVEMVSQVDTMMVQINDIPRPTRNATITYIDPLSDETLTFLVDYEVSRDLDTITIAVTKQ